MSNKKTAVYSRTNSINTSLNIQLEAAKPYLEGIHEEDILFFADVNVQGSSKREGLHKLLDSISKGQIDTLIVYSMDRLTRKLSENLKILDFIYAHKVKVLFSQNGYLAINHDFIRARNSGVLIALLAELEGNHIRKRLKAVIKNKKLLKVISNVNS